MKRWSTRQLVSLASDLKYFIAPKRCISCLKESTWLCFTCHERFPIFPLACIVCNQYQERGLTCVSCKKETPLKRVITAGPYHTPWLRRGIHWFKFKNVRELATPLSYLLFPYLHNIGPLELLQKEACLIPIPLHPKRLRERGFNQSEDMARALSAITDIPVLNVLTRKRSTFTQSRLPKELRLQNISDAFELQGEIPSHFKTVILIDDVTTSGATLTSAAKTISAQYTSLSICGATIARG